MSKSIELNTNKDLYFVELKVSREIYKNEPQFDLFDKKEYCDEFIKALVHCIDKSGLNLYGFVILANQIHLIISSPNGNLSQKIFELKMLSAKKIVLRLSKKLSSFDQVKNREQMDFRRFFNRFLNSDELSFWQKEKKYIALNLKNKHWKIEPISSAVLIAHLNDSKRNYMHLGTTTFTKLMIKSMSI